MKNISIEKELLEKFDFNRLLEITKSIVKLESEAPPGNEVKVGDYIYDFFKDLGYEPYKQICEKDRANILLDIHGSKELEKSLLYSGHIDVVPVGNVEKWTSHPYNPEIRDGKLYGRGTSDMKGSIACMMYLAELLAKEGLKLDGDLKLAFDVDEENTNLGLKKIIEEGVEADWCLVGEPTNLEIALGHRGVMAFTVNFKGRSVHAAQAQRGENAIYNAMAFIEKVKELNDHIGNVDIPYIGKGVINVTMIQAGTKVNIIPDECMVRIDRRLIPGETKESCIEELKQILNQLELEKSSEIIVTTYCPPGIIDEQNVIVTRAKECVESIVGCPVLKGFEASCEAGLITEELGIPTMILGPGHIAQAHTVDEYIDLEQLEKGMKVYISLICKLLCEA